MTRGKRNRAGVAGLACNVYSVTNAVIAGNIIRGLIFCADLSNKILCSKMFELVSLRTGIQIFMHRENRGACLN